MALYSERFLVYEGQGLATFTVAIGNRAIIKCVTLINQGSTNGLTRLLVAGRSIWSGSVPASAGLVSPVMAVVAYGGELIQIYNETSGMGVSVSGYLFDDAARGATKPVDPGPGPRPTPLPTAG